MLSRKHLQTIHDGQRLAGAGASDCASCVGVLLEVARTTIADPGVRLAAPLVVLLNGAEETFLQVPICFGQLLRTSGNDAHRQLK